MEADRTIVKFVVAALAVVAVASRCAFISNDSPFESSNSRTVTSQSDRELNDHIKAALDGQAAPTQTNAALDGKEMPAQTPKDELDGTEVD